MAGCLLALYKKVLVLDGSFGAQLESEGFMIQGDPFWSARALITNPAKVVEIHKQYLSAGAQIIETNSYGYQAAIPLLRKEFGEDGQNAEDLVRSSVLLARRAISEFCQETGRTPEEFLVAGSIGPYAVILHDGSEYSGSYIHTVSHKDIAAYYQGQAATLLEGGVDILAFETIPSLAEAKLIVEVLKGLPNPAYSWISFSCRDGNYTCGGDRFADVVSALCLISVVQMIGINCSDPREVTSLLKQGTHGMNSFVVYPNSGEKWDHDQGWCSSVNRVEISHNVREWVAHGAKVIGGCCRVGPDEIKKIAGAVSNLSNPVDLTGMDLNG